MPQLLNTDLVGLELTRDLGHGSCESCCRARQRRRATQPRHARWGGVASPTTISLRAGRETMTSTTAPGSGHSCRRRRTLVLGCAAVILRASFLWNHALASGNRDVEKRPEMTGTTLTRNAP